MRDNRRINDKVYEFDKRNKIYLILYSRETKKQFIKYFDTEFEKDKFKRKLKFSKRVFIIEDSTDTLFTD